MCVRLLFVTFNKDAKQGDPTSVPMARNFSNIWHKFGNYDETNTIMVSPFENKVEDFTRNDLILPNYSPKEGEIDFMGDKHLGWTFNYLGWLASMEENMGADVRMLMEAFSYEAYLMRSTQSTKYDRAKYSDSTIF